ncbi:hypothetical protein ACOMHN_023509 [Nucella lapillus]
MIAPHNDSPHNDSATRRRSSVSWSPTTFTGHWTRPMWHRRADTRDSPVSPWSARIITSGDRGGTPSNTTQHHHNPDPSRRGEEWCLPHTTLTLLTSAVEK